MLATSAVPREAAQLHNDVAIVDFLSSLHNYTPTVFLSSPDCFWVLSVVYDFQCC